ncbi:MAG: MFS transporter [Rhodobiaceae bacterium]|nr:MFS transporter [Rhodobiaceae bacterium]MCC0055742.1 MFS transporter [Rhodobiaceae bacterium]
MNYAFRLSLHFALQFAALGLYLPFFPLWLADRGFAPGEISLILAVPVIVRVVSTPLITDRAGRSGMLKGSMIVLAAGALAAFSLVTVQSGFWPVLIAVSVFSALYAAILPLSEALAMQGVRRFGHDYGRMRLWGSAAFIAANIAGGALIARFGAQASGPGIMLLLAALLGAAFLLPGDVRAHVTVPAGLSGLRRWKVPRELVPLVIAASLIQASHAVYYGFGTLGFEREGIGNTTIGLLWATGVAAEIVLFAAAGVLFARRSASLLIGAGAAGALIRWAAMAFAPAVIPLFALQTLHAFSFALTHYAIVRAIGLRLEGEQAVRVQGINSAIAALIMGVAMAGAGPLFGMFGLKAYFGAALLAAAGLAALWFQPHKAGDGGIRSEPS